MPHEFTPAHEYAEIFPLHDENLQLEPLVNDLKKKAGQRRPILMFEGKVLDGRRRERACHRAGIKPKYKEFKGSHAQAIALVWSENFPQRHLGEGERALCAARFAKAEVGANQYRPERVAQIEPPSSDETTETPTVGEAAAKFKVSVADVKRGKTITEHGSKELQDAVAADKVSLSDAAKVAKEPHGIQVLAIEKIDAGEASTLVVAVKEIKENKKATKKQALCPRCKTVGYREGCIDCASIAERSAKEEPVVDDTGADVPEELRLVFKTNEDYHEANRLLTKLAGVMKRIEESPTRHKKPLDPSKPFEKFYPVMKSVRWRIKNMRPSHLCKDCVGTNCATCRGLQWLSVEEVEALKNPNEESL